MAFYIKVTRQVAESLKLTDFRTRSKDGNVLLWQADVARFPGVTVFERAAYVGGVALTPQQAKAETDGTVRYAEVYTPVEFGGTGKPENPESEEGTEMPDGLEQTAD